MIETLDTIGQIIDPKSDHGRDAVHIAVEPVVAGEKLYPGQEIGFVGDKVRTSAITKLGIVDPYLKGPVYPDEKFWLFIFPRKIVSLRHVWSHPDVPDAVVETPVSEPNNVSASQLFIEQLADTVGVTYNELMNGAKTGYLVGGWQMEGKAVPEEFWNHYEKVTGEKIPVHSRDNFFSCAC